MRVQIRYKYKEYPQAPSLTKKSQTIGKLTTPWIALGVAAIICGAPANMLMNVRDENMYNLLYGIVILASPHIIALTQILRVVIRKALFKKLDKKYAAMLSGKIPLE